MTPIHGSVVSTYPDKIVRAALRQNQYGLTGTVATCACIIAILKILLSKPNLVESVFHHVYIRLVQIARQ